MANGLFTNTELIDSLIIDLNALPKELINGQYIQFCTLVSQMGQKLVSLKKGVPADIESKNKIIEDLKEQLRNCGIEVVTIPVSDLKKDGANDGSN